MDEVELAFGKSPRLRAVVDLEAEVGWDPVGLDGGDVCCDYLGVGVFVCEVDGLGRDLVSEFDISFLVFYFILFSLVFFYFSLLFFFSFPFFPFSSPLPL